jgi:predicted transcriptional regulator of viral defense system
LYAINDPVTKLPKAHPFAIGAAVVSPSAISHWSAFQHWGLTEQVPSVVTVSSPTRTFPPSDEVADAGSKPAWVVAGVRYDFISITAPRFFGATEVWVSERNRVPVFDRERALLDAFCHFHVFGSLSVALEILEGHLEEIDAPRLVDYAVRFGVAAVVKRVGWSLDRLGVPADVLAPLRTYPAKGDSPLDPGRRARGHHNTTWRVIENLGDER